MTGGRAATLFGGAAGVDDTGRGSIDPVAAGATEAAASFRGAFRLLLGEGSLVTKASLEEDDSFGEDSFGVSLAEASLVRTSLPETSRTEASLPGVSFVQISLAKASLFELSLFDASLIEEASLIRGCLAEDSLT